MIQESTSGIYWEIARRVSDREAVRLLKRRRDDLINRACSRHECADIMQELRRLNREVERLEERLGPGR